jgi:hypothetical protein
MSEQEVLALAGVIQESLGWTWPAEFEPEKVGCVTRIPSGMDCCVDLARDVLAAGYHRGGDA